jgi:hypothetical protein
MADGKNNKSNDDIFHCPCGSDQDLPQSQGKDNCWIQCDGCTAWQHNICVGNLEEKISEDYFCEECKPEHHKRFKFGSGPDNRFDIAAVRQGMCAMQRTRDEDAMKKKTRWLVDEVMAIMEEHPGALDAIETGPEDMARISIRIVLFNASVSALERFRASVVRVRFGEKEAVAAELQSLKTWQSPAFMKKMESVDENTWLKTSFGMEGLESMGHTNARTVRRYFNIG